MVCHAAPGESIERIWQSCRKAASGCDCDNVGAVQSSDKHPGTNGAVSAMALLLQMERQGNATGFCAHYSLTDSIFIFPRFAAVLNMFWILFHRLSFFILLKSIIVMTSKMVLMNWPTASKLVVGSIFHTASNVWAVVILIFSDKKWGCLSHPSVEKTKYNDLHLVL